MPKKKIKHKRKRISHLTVGEFYERHGKFLKLKLQGSAVGFDRKILEPTVNHPGLALAGFLTYFAFKRIQVLGNSEQSYLRKLSEDERVERFKEICERDIPCIVTSRGKELPHGLLEVAHQRGIAVFSTPMVTMKFVNAATLQLENEFAPSTTRHGCMVDFRGVGVLIMGESGAGKSEIAIGLLERGGALVADDMVILRQVGGELEASTKDFSRGFIEMRGVGIINVANVFGLGSIRPCKRLDLVIKLKPHSDLNNVDRLGVNRKTYRILDHEVTLVEIPVAPGRDTTRLVAITCLEHQLRSVGYDMAAEFNQRLLDKMSSESTGMKI
ncbi:MAG TPA: HPr(Ser) kinase/phosphatase [Verrucomicrobiales bacterium]|jgi:HPr kinase/phosphorylase|nr:HPr(Ser) kinase/phosphatase [Verrucomicrobiales bacterium]HCI91591.1 HPr(Ser) kinase/phosphatase [Verrucomicrobiales bacterium]HCL96292.1 HPr(Ser) kinase/phosphatase [Verrucomicrobiales bacterium]